jgi:hypothetical protein
MTINAPYYQSLFPLEKKLAASGVLGRLESIQIELENGK